MNKTAIDFQNDNVSANVGAGITNPSANVGVVTNNTNPIFPKSKFFQSFCHLFCGEGAKKSPKTNRFSFFNPRVETRGYSYFSPSEKSSSRQSNTKDSANVSANVGVCISQPLFSKLTANVGVVTNIFQFSISKLILTMVIMLLGFQGYSFCGFYVAQTGASLYNNKSQVIMVRDGRLTTLTMSNDFKGSAENFAMVVPVPEVLRERDIKVLDMGIFDKLDAYSAPRLAEYYDPNPCNRYDYMSAPPSMSKSNSLREVQEGMVADAEVQKVKIEASYSIGEYDILILSSTESKGLKTWLTQNGYAIPENAEEVLEPYIKNDLKFFVVKVNLERKAASGFANLRPIQITYESDRFMLPIRLGMANAKGDQDLIVYAFTKTGRIECANYRTVKIPTNRDITTFVKNDFGDFYTHLFNKIYKQEGKNAVFLEYAWNVSPNFGGMKCDPCVGPPPIVGDLQTAGVHWINESNFTEVFFTRLHVRYSREKFPQDLLFTVTPNKEHFQGRYVVHNPATGDLSCKEAEAYKENLKTRKWKELQEYIALTGKDMSKFEWYAPDAFKSGLKSQKRKEENSWSVAEHQQMGNPDGENEPEIEKSIIYGSTDSNIESPENYSQNETTIANTTSKDEESTNTGALTLLFIPIGFAGLMWAMRKR
jgi:hypothetical protein